MFTLTSKDLPLTVKISVTLYILKVVVQVTQLSGKSRTVFLNRVAERIALIMLTKQLFLYLVAVTALAKSV